MRTRSKVFPGRYDHLAEIGSFVRSAAQEAGLDDFAIYAVEMAVDEACSNIIEHAYQGEGNGDIVCTLEINSSGLTVILEDEGIPFNPKLVKEPDISARLQDRRERGLGLFFIRQLMDKVVFETTGVKKGNRVTMVKYKG